MVHTAREFLQLGGIIIFAILLNIASQFIYKKFSNQGKLQEINATIKELQKGIKELTDSDAKLKAQSEILSLSQSKFQYTLKPMLASSALFIVSFPFISNLFKGFTLLVFEKSYPIIGPDVGWLLTYIFISIIASMVIRKKMGVSI